MGSCEEFIVEMTRIGDGRALETRDRWRSDSEHSTLWCGKGEEPTENLGWRQEGESPHQLFKIQCICIEVSIARRRRKSSHDQLPWTLLSTLEVIAEIEVWRVLKLKIVISPLWFSTSVVKMGLTSQFTDVLSLLPSTK